MLSCILGDSSVRYIVILCEKHNFKTIKFPYRQNGPPLSKELEMMLNALFTSSNLIMIMVKLGNSVLFIKI